MFGSASSGRFLLSWGHYARGLVIFALFFSLILIREVYKDIEDAEIDAGYKATMPVRLGHTLTAHRLLGMYFFPALCVAVHPNPWITGVGGLGLAVLMFKYSELLGDPKKVVASKATMNLILMALLLALLFT